jgi:hypothetical protein
MLPELTVLASGLITKEGLEVDGVKYTFKVTVGGKLGYVVCFGYFCRFICITKCLFHSRCK